jgi:hypothetical protein
MQGQELDVTGTDREATALCDEAITRYMNSSLQPTASQLA